jgi:hypothetical protein
LGISIPRFAPARQAYRVSDKDNREWAKFLQRQADAVSTAADRIHLLRIADELDRLADSIIERPRFGGG